MNICIVCRREVVQDDLALADSRRWCICLACYAAAEGQNTQISGRLARELEALHLEPTSSRDDANNTLRASPRHRDSGPAAETVKRDPDSDQVLARFIIAQPEDSVRHTLQRWLGRPAALVLATYSLLMLVWGVHEAAFHAGALWLAAGCSLLLFWGSVLNVRFAVRAFRQQNSRLGMLLGPAAVVWAAALTLLWLQHARVLSAPVATAELVQLVLVAGVVAAGSQLLARFYREQRPPDGRHRRAPVTLYRVSGEESQR